MSLFHMAALAKSYKKPEKEFIRKGMYEVGRLASLIQELAYLKGCCGSEESDAALKEQISTLADLLTKMVGEAKENLTADQVPAGAYCTKPYPY
jgi:hypothetical protein